MTTIFKIYYTDPVNNKAYAWDEKNLNEALALAERFRREGFTFVTMVSENSEHVGKPGVDSIVDGKTPDGHAYDWNKADRIGKMKRSERNAPIGTDSIEVKFDE